MAKAEQEGENYLRNVELICLKLQVLGRKVEARIDNKSVNYG